MINHQNNVFNSPSRQVTAKVELYNGSTLANTFLSTDAIKSIKVLREGENNKFFGFGVCQKVEITLTDTSRSITINNEDKLKIFFSTGGEYVSSFPSFYVTEAKRDENNNDINIVAYDALNAATAHTIAETGCIFGVDVADFLDALAYDCANVLGLTAEIPIYDEMPAFYLGYDGDANFTGTESIRTALNAIAEVTQTIYYVNSADALVFKKLDKDAAPVLVISKADYFTLTSGDNKTISKIVSATELGDNAYSGDDSGVAQYVKENPLWVLREDLAALLEQAYSNIADTSINVFNCSWRGNPLVEYGDKIALITKDNGIIYTYLLSENIEYSGGLKSNIKWEYVEDKAEEVGASTTIGEQINETRAKVDKANRQIELVATENEINSNRIASLQINTERISASVEEVKANNQEINDEVATLATKVEAAVTAEDVSIQIQKEMANGIDSVTTTTGFTFNEEGLTVSKSGSEMETTITEDGMTVYKNNAEVLTANNKGVKAIDLHATTYLLLGTNSRFEDYGDRTACFWVGGN